MSTPKRVERLYLFNEQALVVDQTDATFSMQNNSEQGFGNLGSSYFTIGTGQCSIDANAIMPKAGMEQNLLAAREVAEDVRRPGARQTASSGKRTVSGRAPI
jgi:hypothetical protein